MLLDTGLFLLNEVLLSRFVDHPLPLEVLERIATLLLDSRHEREEPSDASN